MDISKLKVDVSGLKISVSSAEVIRKITGMAGNLKNLSVESIRLGDNEAHIIGCSHVSFSVAVKILTPSTWLIGSSGKVGFKIADVSVDGCLGSIALSCVSGFSRRETFVAKKIVAAIRKLKSPTDIGSCVHLSGSTIWVDVKKLAACFGVTISGTISDFRVSADAIELDIQPVDVAPDGSSSDCLSLSADMAARHILASFLERS